ncbi:MAG: hypothetical protein U0S36_15665, partial [Candidatus Nanopelagicales bacterium]
MPNSVAGTGAVPSATPVVALGAGRVGDAVVGVAVAAPSLEAVEQPDSSRATTAAASGRDDRRGRLDDDRRV